MNPLFFREIEQAKGICSSEYPKILLVNFLQTLLTVGSYFYAGFLLEGFREAES